MKTAHVALLGLVALGACAPVPSAEIAPAEPQQQQTQASFQLPAAQEVQTTALPGTDLPQTSEAAVVTGQQQGPNPRNFAGRWTADVNGVACSVVLTAGAPRADGARTASATDCGGPLEGANGWRLGDGSIDIVGPNGTLATLGPGAPGQLTGGGVTLVR